MTDNQMMIALILEIERQLTGQGITGFEVSRNQQPTNQYTGADADSVVKTKVFLHAFTKTNDGKSRKYGGTELAPKRADIQNKGKIVQVSVLHSFDESDVNARTPEDMADLVHDLIDSPDAIKALREAGVFLQEVADVRPIFTVNDKDRNESTPNFDLTVNYTSVIVKDSDNVTEVVEVVDGV